jgi:hypothetical protein
MTDKRLALNVPTNFLTHVDFAKRKITSDNDFHSFHRDPDHWALRRYDRCLRLLGGSTKASVAKRLLEIECRFVALLKTVDCSVPVAPLHKRFSSLYRVVNRHVDADDGSEYVMQSLGHKDFQQVPHSINDFRNASTLAEKALIADLIAKEFSESVREIAAHFDYKRGNFGRGAGRTYSLAYAVLALAFEFEAHNEGGRAAGVTVSADGSRHEGLFLDFVLEFIRVVDAGTIGLRPTDGFNERVRKIAQKRAIDRELVGLLDQNPVDADTMLNFMARTDALKA